MTADERAIRHEELLAHMGWVQGLALRLVRDAARAEDVAQEALARTLARPPRRARAGPGLRAFLATATRLLARDLARAELRRGRRERASAREDIAPSTLDVVERNALVQRVSAAVMELGEPYRSTVLYRYLDGLDSREISERMEVGPATVRKRLSRGLAELRVRLDAEHGGSPGAWALAVGPAVARDAVVGTDAACAGGLFAMAGKIQVLAGVTVMAGTVLAVRGALPEHDARLDDPVGPRQGATHAMVEPEGPRRELVAVVADREDQVRAAEAPRLERVDPVTLHAKWLRAAGLPTEAEWLRAAEAPSEAELTPCAAAQGARDLSRASCSACHLRIRADLVSGVPSAPPDTDGPHTELHANGRVAGQGTLRHGRRDGGWTEWHETGGASGQGEYHDGERHGWWTHWHASGARSGEGQYLYGEREGLWVEYREDGSRARSATYRNGKPDGIVRTWHPGGDRMASEVEHHAGIEDGRATTWYPDGTRESRGSFQRGERVGTWHYWHADGAPDEERSGPAD